MTTPARATQAPAPGVQVVYVDKSLVVLDKPAGLLAVPGRGPAGADCLSARTQALYPDALVVHRLDMATSGLMVMARGAAVQAALSRRFAAREVSKTYEALVTGIPCVGSVRDRAWADIRLPLRVDWPNRPRSHVQFHGGKPSHTRWRMVNVEDAPDSASGIVCSRLLLQPVTGRSHQLRVHLMAMGHPILGDDLYAPPALAQAANRLMLHARQLCFRHPANGKPLEFHVPTPF